MSVVAGENKQIGNEDIVRRFSVLLKRDRMAHAYLFVGPQGSGKKATAFAVAQLVNCDGPNVTAEGRSCGECPSCRKIQSGNHPDILVMEAEEPGESLKIAAIRELISRSQLRAYEGRFKIFIIIDAENLTIEGGNALLKTLEEPSRDSLLILTTSAPEKIMATVRSRCQLLRFPPLSRGRMARVLADHHAVEGEEMEFLSRFSEGYLGKALALQSDKLFFRKNEIIDNLVLSRNNEAYLKALLSDKVKIKESLEVLLSWFRDLLLIKAGADPAVLTHADRYSDLASLNTQYTFVQVEEIIAEIVNTSRQLEENLNVKIALTLLRDRICLRS